MTVPADAAAEIRHLIRIKAVPRWLAEQLDATVDTMTVDQWCTYLIWLHRCPPRWKEGAWTHTPV